jgi:hypothetical protein
LGYDIPSCFKKSIPDEMGEDDDGNLILLDLCLVQDQVDISINTSQIPFICMNIDWRQPKHLFEKI